MWVVGCLAALNQILDAVRITRCIEVFEPEGISSPDEASTYLLHSSEPDVNTPRNAKITSMVPATKVAAMPMNIRWNPLKNFSAQRLWSRLQMMFDLTALIVALVFLERKHSKISTCSLYASS